MMHIDHAAFMDGGGDFLLQGLDELPPGDDGVTMGDDGDVSFVMPESYDDPVLAGGFGLIQFLVGAVNKGRRPPPSYHLFCSYYCSIKIEKKDVANVTPYPCPNKSFYLAKQLFNIFLVSSKLDFRTCSIIFALTRLF